MGQNLSTKLVKQALQMSVMMGGRETQISIFKELIGKISLNFPKRRLQNKGAKACQGKKSVIA